MTFSQLFRPVFTAALLCGISACCSPPEENYVRQPIVQKKMEVLKNDFLALLPASQAVQPKAQEEAKWLADTAIAQSAAIARENKTVLYGWLNNILVNSRWRERGLCWHYQQDLYRELRRRPIKYFYIGLTIRDRGTGREHSCVYINAVGHGLKDSLVLDPWKNCGHLLVLAEKDRKDRVWEEDTGRAPFVEALFPEGHQYGMKHHIVWGWEKNRKKFFWQKEQTPPVDRTQPVVKIPSPI